MHAIEAGLMFDPEMMRVVGPRGIAVGVIGSLLPLSVAYAIARGWGAGVAEAFTVGAALAPMSAGITLNVLRTGGVLNQPIGQLVIAAATVNELINIIVYTEVDNLVYGVPSEPFGPWFWYALPVVLNVVLVVVIGLAGIYVVPHVVEERIMPLVPEDHEQNFLLGLLFALALALMCACKFSGGSELLGALLAGVSLCTNHEVHHAWNKQVKRIYAWLMHFFFAATVGFHVPLAELFQVGTLAKAALLLPVILTKLAMGCFAKPMTKLNFWLLAFAWGEWGEFSFLITTLALRRAGKG